MPGDQQRPIPRTGSNPAQLRGDIDSGRTGDKVGGFDPAASPLGTDAEAGGARSDPSAVEAGRLAERSGRPASGTANAATPELQPNGRLESRPAWLMPSLAGAALALVLAALCYFLLRA